MSDGRLDGGKTVIERAQRSNGRCDCQVMEGASRVFIWSFTQTIATCPQRRMIAGAHWPPGHWDPRR